MNKTERIMLSEIYSLTNSIPNFKNNMDTQGYSSFRSDSLQMQKYLRNLTYDLLMFSNKGEDTVEWKNKFDSDLESAKEFVSIRSNEQWNANTKFTYDVAISGW